MKKNSIVGSILNKSFLPLYIGVFKLMPLGFLMALLLFGCSKEEVDVSTSTCNQALKSSISFKSDVYPIIQSNCLTCHDAKNHFGGIVIENYQQISESAKVGELLNSITPYNGNMPMMPKGGRLSDCQIAVIKNWINQGINNN